MRIQNGTPSFKAIYFQQKPIENITEPAMRRIAMGIKNAGLMNTFDWSIRKIKLNNRLLKKSNPIGTASMNINVYEEGLAGKRSGLIKSKKLTAAYNKEKTVFNNIDSTISIKKTKNEQLEEASERLANEFFEFFEPLKKGLKNLRK